jgi:probable HAF family extracellular repeat protein
VAAWINDKGQVVGSSGACAPAYDPNAGVYLVENHALLWENGKLTDLGNLGTQGFAGNHACQINNQGQVVGHTNSDTSTRAYLWTRATGMQNLGTLPPGDFASLAIGINDGGEVVGVSVDGNFNARAFLWEKGVMTDLNSLIASNPSGLQLQVASSINASGEIIGVAQTGAGETHGFLATPH